METSVHYWFSLEEEFSRERLVGPRTILRGIGYQVVQKEKQLGSRRLGQVQLGGTHIHY
jgi:hypothetical protein